MNRIPVGETIRFAYDFTFRELGTIIGLIWVPMVGIAVLAFLPYAMGDMVRSPDINPAAAGAIALRGIVFWMLNMLLSACISVAVMRQALGLRTGPALVHLSVGRAELRVWGATLLLLGIVLVLAFGLALAVIVSAVAMGVAGSKAATAAVAVVVGLVGTCALLYALTRLGFLLVPITVKEEKISFERGWTLTNGNFWRITAVLFVVTLPTAILFMSAFVYLLGPEMIALWPQAQHLGQEALADKIQAIVNSHIATMLGIQLIIAPFSVGLVSGASAFAYKALTSAAAVPTPQP
jgi:hypothetical protein